MERGWSRFWESSSARPSVGLLSGVALVVATLTLDASTSFAERGFYAIAAGNARSYLAGLLGGSFTVAAMVFWVRGMLVQLAAGALHPRVVRSYLNDRFMHNTLALILATFIYSAVLLLRLPADPTAPAPFVAVVGALLLGTAALVGIVVMIVDSVRTTDEAHLVGALTAEAIAAVHRRFPESGEGRADERVPVDDDAAAGTGIGAAGSGWLEDIEIEALFAALPDECHLTVEARSGIFVAEGTTLARLARVDGGEVDLGTVRALQRAFVIGRQRKPAMDVEFALGQLLDVAGDQLGSGPAGRTGGHEALMHLALVLREVARRGEQDVCERRGDRSVAWTRRLERSDVLHEMMRVVTESGRMSAAVAVTLLRGLGIVQRDLDAADPLHEEVRRHAAALVGRAEAAESAHEKTDVRRVAEEEGLVEPREPARS